MKEESNVVRLDAQKPVHFCDNMTRRDFLHAGSLAMLGLSMPEFIGLKTAGAVQADRDINCIMIFLLGGPSHLDTWDMKPDAPAEIRGPYRPIPTNADGIYISEIFPKMAKHADKYALVRSVNHTAAPVHDKGHQLMQTGRLFAGEMEHPHIGCVLSALKGPRGDVPAHMLLPTPMGATGGNLPHGQSAGYLGATHDPVLINADFSKPGTIASIRESHRHKMRDAVDTAITDFEASEDAEQMSANFSEAYTVMSSQKARESFDLVQESESVRKKYGMNKFGQSCLLARRMVERGVRFVTINMFETVFNEITWDIHGSRPFTPITAYRDVVGPWFDNGYSALLEELSQRGLLETTLVVAMGEFGRTPKINPAGGRDHWPQCWTILFAGGSVNGGQAVGASDEIGAYPKDRPVTCAEVAATIYYALGVDLEHELLGPQARPIPIVDSGVTPIMELF